MFQFSDKYKVNIGLEIHVQLSTKSKLFSSDPAHFTKEPNTHVSVISLGHPGSLPKLNEAVVAYAVTLGLAVQSSLSRKFSFARKNYFYTDLPKSYQISQDSEPICVGGFISVSDDQDKPKKIRLTRIHMEEDAGKSIHDQDPEFSKIDLNRAGVPLLEIVSEPEISSPAEAHQYVSEVRRLVRHLGICDGNMEEGSLRCDANVSIRQKENIELGTRTEIKNLNSINFVKKAIEKEIMRQVGMVENGERIERQTLGYIGEKDELYLLRSKEEAHDYRYFPDPDLPHFELTDAFIESVKKKIAMLPWDWEKKFVSQFGLGAYDASLLAEEKEFALFFDEVCAYTSHYKAAANWLIGPVRSWLNEKKCTLNSLHLSPVQLAKLIELVQNDKVNLQVAQQEIFTILLWGDDTDPFDIAVKNHWLKETDTEKIRLALTEILEKYPDKFAEYKKGKKNLAGLFIGELMKSTGGKADPKAAMEILQSFVEQKK